jgi:S-adenosylmethionine decarboxylase
MTPPLRNPTVKAIGRHLLADLQGIAAEPLQDESLLREIFVGALLAAGFTILDTSFHKFGSGGFGVTGMALLSESHAAFHTYPEFGYLALDVFSCGEQDPQHVLRAIVARLEPNDCQYQLHSRG